MGINYIILAHQNPQQVQRLINRLDTSYSNFYIHIDKGVNIIPFRDVLSNKPNIFFIDEQQREYGTWGDIGIVKATIAILSQIVKDNRTGYCILMSGQDYPLKNNPFISDFFETNYGANFIVTYPLPNRGWGAQGGLDRLNQYKVNLSNSRMDFVQLPSIFDAFFYKKQTIGKLKKLLKRKHFSGLSKILLKRKLLKNIKPYGGSQWWAFPIETIKDILAFINSTPEYLKYHSDTLLPDEIFFHSILMYLKEKNENIIIKPSITHANWERKNTSLPVTYKKEDIEELKIVSNNKLFARKFDMAIDEEILSIIDENLLKKINESN
ncbi:beta-1,6-N-acetylglucosaminyltransferase [Flavobacterium sp.]|uniref:beta-1,6-N-acetylglucosaminyltransferase n=1 Tax=Flavobacterium sp. TaxID=239 RepID=UPI002B4B13B7|nr:beta-1,6-N-acetylglucosaminyltransferase [Flavobacterium sp.]HLF51222.1 beta-1,6-N-acetylglucosaminyltransferase [Flavobacterium sp.]